MAYRIAGDIVSRISPPPPTGTPPQYVLAAVLAERHRRELERLRAVPGRVAAAVGTAPAVDATAARTAATAAASRRRADRSAYRSPISISTGAMMAVTVRTWFQAVHVERYACHSRAASASESAADRRCRDGCSAAR